MFVRQIGDEFEILVGDFLYTLRCEMSDKMPYHVGRTSLPSYDYCVGCFFYGLQAREPYGGKCPKWLTGDCKNLDQNYICSVVKKRDKREEITKTDIKGLTSAVKSIGESLKIVEMFKQLAEQNKNKTE